jgi:transposase
VTSKGGRTERLEIIVDTDEFAVIDVAKYEAGGLDSDTAAADVLADYEARIAALERLVGKLALENEFLKGASRHCRQPRSASTSVVAGPVVSQSQKDAG